MATKSIFVTGDIANDHFLVKGKRFNSDDKNSQGTNYVHLNGGAFLISDLLNSISEVRKTNTNAEHLDISFGYNQNTSNQLPDKNNGFVSLTQFKNPKKEITWKIDDFLGYGDKGKSDTDFTSLHLAAKENSDIYIFDDAGMDFATERNKTVWSSLIESAVKAKINNSDSLVIYKKSSDFERNNFFETLMKASEKKQLNLLTIISIDEIRKLDVKVSMGISWEQSAIDLVAELKSNTTLSVLLKSNYLIVTFQSSGALFVVNDGNGNFEYSLIFDPENMEGENETSNQGKIIGRMSVFTAALASNLDLSRKDKHYKTENAIKAGLTAIRLLYIKGYVRTDNGIRYPFEEIAKELEGKKDFAFSSAPVPQPDAQPYIQDQKWSILINNYADKDIEKKVQIKALSALAKNIVLKGYSVLNNIPSGKFGHLFTVDRSEIESLRNLKKIMETYVRIDKGKKPLSLGVFGPPGAGKSFAVEEIGQGIMGENYKLLTFNLSQFSNPEDLIGALHLVRDSVIKKEIPIVFWDEFDSQSYKWLQYLLAPMQDGVFQDGQLIHPVGKCIFVFAGATSYNMEAFGKFNTEEAKKDFILKKGPDFISRLNGYINILGPNKRQIFNPNYTTEEDKWVDDPTDLTYPVRRAIFIIGLLRLNKDDFPFKMDNGLLNGLIKVDRYKHGSRSLSNLLTDIKQNNPRNLLLRSWLPSKPTLELYFKDIDDFYKCITREDDFLEKAWEVAPLIHSYYCKSLNNPTEEYSVEYSYLPVFIKESNVQAAMRIPEVLKTGGFILTRKDAADTLSEVEYLNLINDKVLLEKMAEKEHDLWVKFYKDNGWEYAENRNDYAKKHNCIVPYNKLPESEKEKDRDVIRKYIEIVEKLEFGIAKI